MVVGLFDDLMQLPLKIFVTTRFLATRMYLGTGIMQKGLYLSGESRREARHASMPPIFFSLGFVNLFVSIKS